MQSDEYIVHLVQTRNRLVEILREGFVPNYHKEDLSSSEKEKDKFIVGIPMTSFADVPIDQLDSLKKEYGNYGIIMSKDWALKADNLSPVHYVTDMRFLDAIIKSINECSIPLDTIRYTKKYISEWNREPYLNYVEREWRHALPDNIADWYKSEKDYNDWRYQSFDRPSPTEILKHNTLTFDVQDIVGIILDEDEDRIPFMHDVSELEGNCSVKYPCAARA